MSSGMKMRWLVVCAIWGVALALTYWNGIKINTVAAARDSNERRYREIDFQRRNAEQLARVSKTHETLFSPVESLDLGIVGVRSRLGALAAAFGLEMDRIQIEPTQMTGERIPCTLTLRGLMGHGVGFITALQKHPYLSIRKMTIASQRGGDEIDMQIKLDFRYRIVNPPERSVAMPQEAPTPEAQGAEAL